MQVIAYLPAGGGLTMEASFMIRSYHPIPGVGVAGLVTQWGSGGLMASLVLAGTESNNPSVRFSIAIDGAEVTYQPAEPLIGDWHQAAGVYRVGDDAGQSTMELWLDGKKVGEKSFPIPEKQNVLPLSGFAFGVDAPTFTQGKTTGRVIDGLLDDVAISTEPLTPGTFFFPNNRQMKSKRQNFELKSDTIRTDFELLMAEHPEKLVRKLDFSWSNWGFGIERLEDSAIRLQRADIHFIELHGNHYGADLGYQPKETLKILSDHDIRVAGVCGMFSADNDLSSNRPIQRQAAVDYIRRELDFCAAVGGSYLLVVPGAVGRPRPYDQSEFQRSAETLNLVGDLFVKHGVKAAIEPIRAAEVSLVHTIAEATEYLEGVAHPGVAHINGDVYHMQSEEEHIGSAIIAAGDRLTNLHMADSNRCALGKGSIDVDTIIRALYLIEYNQIGRYVTPEPLGPGGDPYPAMYGNPNRAMLDEIVATSASYFRCREKVLTGKY